EDPLGDLVQAGDVDHRVHHRHVDGADVWARIPGGQRRDDQLRHADRELAHRGRGDRGVAGAADAEHAVEPPLGVQALQDLCRSAAHRLDRLPSVAGELLDILAGGGRDLGQGAPPALLVYLKPKLGLSYTEAAGVILAATLSSSVIQPAFGFWSDRRGARWLLSAGVALGGVGIALAAISSTYPVLLLLVFLSGLGIGAFHPEGAKFAGFASGDRRATGMALFAIGGNAGFALGPLLVSVAVGAWGLDGGLLLAAPCLL